MRNITFPLKPKMRGNAVVHLQEGLLLLLEKNRSLFIPPPPLTNVPPPPDWPEIIKSLQQEQQNKFYGKITRGLINNFQKTNNLLASGAIDEATAKALDHLLEGLNDSDEPSMDRVKGRVALANGDPAVGLSVLAFDRDMRDEQLLVQTSTDASGRYQIAYTRSQFLRAEKERADLLIRVMDEHNNEISASRIFFNAEPDQTIDLTLQQDQYRGFSEYKRYIEELHPLIGNVSLANLKDEDIQFLTGETGISVAHLRFLRLDAQWSDQHDVEQAVFYGLLRQGLPTNDRRLLAEKRSRLHKVLKAAIDQNIIPMALEASADDILDRLHELAVEAAFQQENEADAPPLGILLGTTPELDEAQQRQFVRFTLRYETNGKDGFWDKLQEETDLADEAVHTLQFTLQSAPLLQGHLPTLKAVQDMKVNRGWSKALDLAALSRDEVLEMTAQTAADHPPKGFEDHKRFAEAISHSLEVAFPTAVVTHGLAQDPDLGSADLNVFLNANETFDFLRTPVKDFLNHGAVLAEVQDPEALQVGLLSLQRVLRIVPERQRFANLKEMTRQGYTSAFAVVNTGQARFVETMTPAMGEAAAIQTYANARARAEATQMLHQQLGDFLTFPSPVIPHLNPGESEGELPTWVDLFGSLKACACEHCRSMYSPAAYMLELLSFLDEAPESPKPLPVLLERRPDLQHIKLNCANASTTMPYIDLVNEILEEAVAPFADEDWARYQTPDSNGESKAEIEARLRARPEHEHLPAYDSLENAVHPWLLPFSLKKEKILLLAQHLGLDFVQLYEVFGRSDDWVTQAHLKLTNTEWEGLITPASTVTAAWGVHRFNVLNSVTTFLKQSGLTYEALQALVGTSFFSAESAPVTEGTTIPGDVPVIPSAPPVIPPIPLPALLPVLNPIITLHAGSDPCDMNDDTLSGLDASILDRIHRFLRLRQTLSWTIRELDTVLTAFGYTDITASALRDIVRIQRLAEIHRQAVSRLVMLDGPRLAELMRISEVEVNVLASLTGMGDVTILSLNDQLDLLEKWQDFRHSGFELRELAYILQGKDQSPAVFVPAPADLEAFLRALHETVSENEIVQLTAAEADIQRAVNAHAGSLPADIGDEAHATALSAFRNRYIEALTLQFAMDAIVQNVAQFFSLPPDVLERLIAPSGESTQALIEAQSTMGSSEHEPAITDFLDLMREGVELPEGSRAAWDEPMSDVTEGLKAAYDDVAWLLIRLGRAARLLNTLKITRRELDAMSQTQTENGFLDLNQLRPSHNPPDHPQSVLYEQYFALVKAKQIQRAMPRAEHDLFDFLIHPAASTESMIDSLAGHTGWDRDPSTGEPMAMIAPLLRGLEGLAPTDTLDLALFRRVETYARLNQTYAWLRRWRITPGTLVLWSARESTRITDLVESLEATARARFSSDAAWYKILTPMIDRLREKKRDALLAFLMARDSLLETPSDAYAHYLIDLEMSSCMLTSRIKQANASIQLFVQRIRMNLEADARLEASDDDHWKRWEWMKNYRVWEANRKVFLYPENWIEPELRDDKSVFFKELENELLQDELNDTTVERVYRNYLEKFDDVAHLDVCSLYHDEGRQILHIFARTFNEPHIYYHRYRNMKTGVWAAWKKIELNIEGDHIIPVVHNGRLLLFWAVFTENDTFWDLNIFWSEFKNGKWLARKSRSNKSIISLELRDIQIRNGVQGFPRSSFFFRISTETDELRFFLYTSHFAILEASLDALLPYSIAVFTFDECTQELRVKQDINRVQFVAFPPRMKPDYTHLSAEDEHMQVYQSIGSSDFLAYTPLPDFYAPDITEQIRITVDEYKTAFNALISDAIRLNIRNSVPDKLFENPIEAFSLVPDHQSRQFTAAHPFLFILRNKPYLVTPEVSSHTVALSEPTVPGGIGIGGSPVDHTRTLRIKSYAFETFYHPFSCNMIRQFNRGGVEGLLAPLRSELLHRQLSPSRIHPLLRYDPILAGLSDVEDIDFSLTASYGLYNWELFFHIPLLIATRLSQAQRFEEAQRWFHYIFDPTDISTHPKPAKYWRVKPFFELSQEPIETLSGLLRKIAGGNEQALEQIHAWRDDPFNPHHIARLRNIAYMKNVLMKYIDNCIAWGDQLFQLDTMETINEATQLYILAAELLGERPVTVKQIELRELSYAELTRGDRDRLDALNNAWIDLESGTPIELDGARSAPGGEALRLHPYFCIPENDKLFDYWDTVADRLFKIRHCMNIQGQVRTLPLFEPPIDPALLVRARAAGLDLRTVLSLTRGLALPNYRYSYTYQKALEFCNEVRSLGNVLLSALEKRDAEALSLLRSRHEMALLTQTRIIKKKQIEEAEEARDGLLNGRELAEERLAYYSTRDFMNASELLQITSLTTAHVYGSIGQGHSLAASVAHLIPDTKAGAPMSIGTTFGGSNLGNSLKAIAGVNSFIASQHSFAANMSSIVGGYQRREDDWRLQATLAEKELAQIDNQIAAADIRLAIAEQDLSNHESQLDQAREVNDYMRSKFTNQELYGWMAGQLSALHYQAYQMAIDLARKAERAAQHELGITASDFQHIGFEHWDSQKKGLLAGERLNQQLRRMDAAFMEQHERRLELTKHLSLAMLNPMALLQLKETGRCVLDLPETLFDLDYPGHYNRRIKSVSLTIPCVTGPYTTVSCTLRLQWHSVRVKDSRPYERSDSGTDPDTRFRDDYSPLNQSIATSGAQNDSGLFELNFRDERYLPFEGAGVISRWQIDLPDELRQFDYDTISDVILHLRYTAQTGSSDFKTAATDYLLSLMRDAAESGLTVMFSAKRDFPDTWHTFLHPANTEAMHRLQMDLSDRFPYMFRDNIRISKVHVFFVPRDAKIYQQGESASWQPIVFGLERMDRDRSVSLSWTLPATPSTKLPPYAELTVPDEAPALWQLTVDGAQEMTSPLLWRDVEGQVFKHLKSEAVEDVILICEYYLGDTDT